MTFLYTENDDATPGSHRLLDKKPSMGHGIPPLKLLVSGVRDHKQDKLLPMLFVAHQNLMVRPYC